MVVGIPYVDPETHTACEWRPAAPTDSMMQQYAPPLMLIEASLLLEK
jgi:hypothetical protein